MLLANFAQENRNQTMVLGAAYMNPLGRFGRPQLYQKFYVGDHVVSGVTDRSAWPQGTNTEAAYVLAPKAGGLGSHFMTEGRAEATLSLADGRNIAASNAGIATASATLQLVVNLAGTAAGSTSGSGSINAALGLSASGTASATASATATAAGWLSGEASGSCTASAVRYATGALSGSISPFTDLSPENLAAAVIAAAQSAPIHADIRKVNDYAVSGDGQSGTEWGPA